RIRAGGGTVKPGSKPKAAAEAKPTKGAGSKRAAPKKEAGQKPSTAARAAPEEGNGQVAAEPTPAPPAEPTPAAVVKLPEAAPAEPAGIDAPAATAAVRVRVARGATAQELADKLEASASDIVKTLFAAGEMVSVTQSLTDEAVELVAESLGVPVEIVAPEEEEAGEDEEQE